METDNLKTLTVYAVRAGEKMRQIPTADADKYKPEALAVWTLHYAEPLVEHEINAGRAVAQQGLIGPAGMADDATVILAKGASLLRDLVRAWDRKAQDGTDLPVTADNLGTLPKFVVRQFAVEVLYGTGLTEEELAAAKK